MSGIFSNSSSFGAQNGFNSAYNQANNDMDGISSGYALTEASNNIANLSISTGLKSDISSSQAALQNANQASDLLNVAGGALSNISDILGQQLSLATQANSGALNDQQRAILDQQFQSLSNEVGQISQNTNFNGQTLLDGSASLTFQVGSNPSDGINVNIPNATPAAIYTDNNGNSQASSLSIATQAGASSAVSVISNAINNITSAQSNIASTQSMFDSSASNLQLSIQNQEAANSNLSETDIPSALTNAEEAKVQEQASLNVISTENKASKNILNLLS